MATKTENLAIMMTDIVDFTKITMHQSRAENEQLLATHNRLLLPILKHYHGRHVKSIGDALLTVFKSPTDAMLCAMAMQDALFQYNQSNPEHPIHIRIGASLGEVRVTRNDIFGDPVNLTSRVEGVTPADEIYLTEALYMAMNKAEVPAEEVGWKEIKGLKEPVRLYSIPRFSESRLVPQEVSTEDLAGIAYPYGGAHLSFAEELKNSRFRMPLTGFERSRFAKAIIAIPVLVIAAAIFLLGRNYGDDVVEQSSANAFNQPLGTSEDLQRPNPQVQNGNDDDSTKSDSSAGTSVASSNSSDTETLTAAAASSEPPLSASPTSASPAALATSAEVAYIQPTTVELFGPPITLASIKQAAPPKPAPKPKVVWNVRKAKSAYREGRISKPRYREIIYDLKVNLKNNIRKEKENYRAGRIDKAEYRRRVYKLEANYEG